MNDASAFGKTYDPESIEQPIYERWESTGCFKPSGEGDPYCIMIPPPNVTGSLHMGHAFQDTIMDALTRYYRMKGCNTLWQPGTDHAGIATQMVVERQLNAEGKTRHDLGRDAFIDRVWDWKAESGGTITKQLRRMGASVDWERERFTMDEGLSAAVREVFVKLHQKDLIYRGKRLVNWDPVLHTALSDIEVLSEEKNGHLWHMRYPLSDGTGELVVATTRPETMLGDTAVAVHPEDERYADMVGKTITLPLVGREIPIIADDYVDPEFGSGCVKITPAHDFNDYEVGTRHDLPIINIFNDDAAIVLPDTPYDGLDRFDARKRVIADLEAAGLMAKIEDHKLMVPHGDRSGVVVEPYLTDQWFVRAEALAIPSIKAVESGQIKFVPENWANTYYEWMRNIQDWCISRQIWWGHRIPAWYDSDGNIFVALNESDAQAQAREKHGKDVELRQDDDVLIGWPEETEALKTWYPTSVLVTGFDIIFFWVARMIMFGLEFMQDVPFREVYMHGLVRDADGQKMSKSKGNVLDPLDLIDGIDLESLVTKRTRDMMQPHLAKSIEKATRRQFPDGIPAYGTDALRFTFASQATLGRDIRFDLGRIGGYRNFCNKVWNAARFVMMNVEGKDCGTDDSAQFELGAPERWIISRLQQTEEETNSAFEGYRFDRAAQSTYAFVWDEYCDWYLELAKTVLNDDSTSEARKIGTRHTLVRVLEASLRLLHPLTPYITEALWQQFAPLAGKSGETIMTQPYPVADASKIDAEATAEIDWIKDVVSGVRTIRGEMNIEPGKKLNAFAADLDERQRGWLAANATALNAIARLDSLEPADAADHPDAAMAVSGQTKVLIPLGDLIDRDAELARLSKERDKVQSDFSKVSAKLENPNFVDKAPAAVVDKERARLTELESMISDIETQIERMTVPATAAVSVRRMFGPRFSGSVPASFSSSDSSGVRPPSGPTTSRLWAPVAEWCGPA